MQEGRQGRERKKERRKHDNSGEVVDQKQLQTAVVLPRKPLNSDVTFHPIQRISGAVFH